jgi:hypothetical protein
LGQNAFFQSPYESHAYCALKPEFFTEDEKEAFTSFKRHSSQIENSFRKSIFIGPLFFIFEKSSKQYSLSPSCFIISSYNFNKYFSSLHNDRLIALDKFAKFKKLMSDFVNTNYVQNQIKHSCLINEQTFQKKQQMFKIKKN